MLALRTGWTPDVIGGDGPGGVSDAFRRAAHFALYAERLAPVLAEDTQTLAMRPEDVDAPFRARLNKARERAHERTTVIRTLLLLDPGDG